MCREVNTILTSYYFHENVKWLYNLPKHQRIKQFSKNYDSNNHKLTSNSTYEKLPKLKWYFWSVEFNQSKSEK